jgi:hypothetical protein
VVTFGIRTGVAVYPDDGNEAEALLNIVDKAMPCLKTALVQDQSCHICRFSWCDTTAAYLSFQIPDIGE